MSQSIRERWAAWLVAILIVLSIISFFIIVPIIQRFSQNSGIIILVGLLVLIAGGSILVNRYQQLIRKIRISQVYKVRSHGEEEKRSEEELRKKEAFEGEQRAMGLAKYRDRQGLEIWGSAEDIENWRRIDAAARKLERTQEKEEVIDVLLLRIKKCRHDDFQGLNQDQIHHIVNNWKMQISTLLDEGKSADSIIDVICSNR